jgi:hypothetical protein
MNNDERQLWRAGDFECVMISCCSGAELQIRRADAIVLRELYPTKSDLYERARGLKGEYDQKEPQRPQSSPRE